MNFPITTKILLLLLFAVCGMMVFSVGAETAEEWCAKNEKKFPLHCAAKKGDVAEIERLVAAGAEVNERTEKNSTPLHLAARGGHAKAVIALIRVGAKVTLKDKGGAIPLHDAAGGGNVEAIVALIDAGSNINAVGGLGWTPLHTAALHKRLKAIVALAEAGANLNRVSEYTGAPLHLAVSFGQKESVVALVKVGAKLNLRNKDGKTPLDIAIQKKGRESEIAVFLRKAKSTQKSKPAQEAEIAQWAIDETSDEMTGENSIVMDGAKTAPTSPMKFPYQDTKAQVVYICDANRESISFWFTGPVNLSGGKYKGESLKYMTTRIKWNDMIIPTEIAFAPDGQGVYFVHPKDALRHALNSSSVLVELDWWNNGNVYFRFSLKGLSEAVKKARKKCSLYQKK